MKHQEHIAAFELEPLKKIMPLEEGFNPFSIDLANTFFKETLPALVFKQRLWLDDQTPDKVVTHKQLLPYVFVTKVDSEGNRWYMVYQRAKGIGESRLLGKHSIGFGGHVDIDDVQTSSDGVVNIGGLIGVNAVRELMEELSIYDVSPDGTETKVSDHANKLDIFEEMIDCSVFHGLINDNSDHVGRDHLGIVISVELPAGTNVHINESELLESGWFTMESLKNHSEFVFENWSKILVEQQ